MVDSPELDRFDEVKKRLTETSKVFLLTGAGISAESGIPTFRGSEGYWKKHAPEQLASPEGFARDPKLVWEWYNHRRKTIAAAEPNEGHFAVAEIERRAKSFLLCTQNVDGLHRLAGTRKVVEIHGSIWRLRPVNGGGALEDRTIFEDHQLPPRDSENRLLRPDVVWFGETIPAQAFETIETFLSTGKSVDLAFVIGTTALFPYIQRWIALLLHARAFIIEVNPSPVLPEDLVAARWGKGWATAFLKGI